MCRRPGLRGCCELLGALDKKSCKVRAVRVGATSPESTSISQSAAVAEVPLHSDAGAPAGIWEMCAPTPHEFEAPAVPVVIGDMRAPTPE